MGHDQQGRGVYFQCEAEFKNKPGQLEIREDGLTFTGEVVIEIPWSNVVHAAKTTHTFQGLDYAALALLEGKRRTPTKFVSTRDYDATYAVEVTMRLWGTEQETITSDLSPQRNPIAQLLSRARATRSTAPYGALFTADQDASTPSAHR